MTQSDIFTESPFARKLTAVTVPPGAAGVEKLAMELSPALFGTGPSSPMIQTTHLSLLTFQLFVQLPDQLGPRAEYC